MDCRRSSYCGCVRLNMGGARYLATGTPGRRPRMAGHMVALRRESLWWWWLLSRVVWTTGGVAMGSSDVPFLRWGGVLIRIWGAGFAALLLAAS